MQALKRGSIAALTLARRRMLISLEISNRDPGYAWFLSWMAKTQKEQKGLAARWSRSQQLSLQTSVHQAREHATPDV